MVIGFTRLTTLTVLLMVSIACGASQADPDDIVLSYSEAGGGFVDSPAFELELHRRFVRFHGLTACSLPARHTYRISPTVFDSLVDALRNVGFFQIARTAAYRQQSHATVLTIAYRDRVRTHETVISGDGYPQLRAFARRMRKAVNVERFLAPSRAVYEELLSAGWNVNRAGELDGETALSCATRAGPVDAIRVLLDHRAMVTPQAWLGAIQRQDSAVQSLLYSAAPLDWGTREALVVLFAAAASAGPALEYFVDRAAPVNAVDDNGKPLVMATIAFGSETLRNTELLLSNGADPNRRDRSGSTPLHRAARSLNTGFITMLAAHGADVNARDREDKTPLMLAAEDCYYWNVRSLLLVGANRDQAVAPDWPAAVAGRKGTQDPKCRTTKEVLESR